MHKLHRFYVEFTEMHAFKKNNNEAMDEKINLFLKTVQFPENPKHSLCDQMNEPGAHSRTPSMQKGNTARLIPCLRHAGCINKIPISGI